MRGRVIHYKTIMLAALLIHFSFVTAPVCNLLPRVVYWPALSGSFIILLFYSLQWKKRTAQKGAALLFMLFTLFALLFSFIKRHSFFGMAELCFSMLQFGISILFSVYCVKNNDEKFNIRVFKCLTAVVIFITCTTLIGLYKNPEAAREIAGGEGTREYYQSNVAGFSFIYGLVVLAPCFFRVFWVQRKVQYLLCAALFSLCIVMGQFTIAIAFAMFGLLLVCISRIITKRKVFMIAAVFTVSFFLLNRFYAEILRVMSGVLKRWNIRYLALRFENYAEILEGLFTQRIVNRALDMRIGEYLADIDLFFRNPLCGLLFRKTQSGVSGHSDILDVAGGLGMTGIALYLCVIIFYFRIIRGSCYDGKKRFYMLNLSVSLFVLLSLANPVMAFPFVGYASFLFPVLIENICMKGRKCEASADKKRCLS